MMLDSGLAGLSVATRFISLVLEGASRRLSLLLVCDLLQTFQHVKIDRCSMTIRMMSIQYGLLG